MEKKVRQFVLEKAHNGSLTGKVRLATGRSFYLHSRWNPEQEATDWLAQVEVRPNTLYLVLGFGLGYHVRALLNKLPGNSRIAVIDYSQTENTSQLAFQNLSDSSWMTDERLKVFCGPDIRVLAGILYRELRTNVIKRITTCRHFPTMQAYPEFYQQVDCELVPNTEEMFRIDAIAADEGRQIRIRNFWKNLSSICASPGIKPFKDRFRGVPAVIVSAGPSLNKNIHQLAKYLDKALVIASGSAMGALHAAKIEPHFLAVADPFPGMFDSLEKSFCKRTALLAYYETEPRTVSLYPGNRCFCFSPADKFYDPVIRTLLPPSDPMPIIASVAMTAFQFALYCGADPIVFVGQDCAFADDVAHADGVASVYNFERRAANIVTVTGHHGEVLRTDLAYKAVLEGFVQSIAALGGSRKIINATEGGAYMKGAEHMPLAQAGDTYFAKRQELYGIIDCCFAEFQPGDHKPIIEYLQHLDEELQKVQTLIRQNLENTAEYSTNEVVDGQVKVKIDVEKASNDHFRDQMKELLLFVKKSPIYPFIESYLGTLLEQFAFQQTEEMRLDEEMLSYALLRGNAFYIISELRSYVREALLALATGDSESVPSLGA
jgi:hypothetical protein